MSGRTVSVTSEKNGSKVKSVSQHGEFVHLYDESGKYSGSEIKLPDSNETVYGDKEGNLVDKDGYGISISKERSIEKHSPEDFKIISETKPLNHVTSKIKLPEKNKCLKEGLQPLFFYVNMVKIILVKHHAKQTFIEVGHFMLTSLIIP